MTRLARAKNKVSCSCQCDNEFAGERKIMRKDETTLMNNICRSSSLRLSGKKYGSAIGCGKTLSRFGEMVVVAMNLVAGTECLVRQSRKKRRR